MSPKTESNSGMPTRTLGRTGVQVSLIGLGGWHLGFNYIDEELSIRIIRTAIDNGINFIATKGTKFTKSRMQVHFVNFVPFCGAI